MVLFDQIVEVLRGAHLRVLGKETINFHLTHGPMRRGIPVERDRLRWPALMLDLQWTRLNLTVVGFSC
jgi:hypothetical protein